MKAIQNPGEKTITPRKVTITLAAAGGIYLAMGWPFFHFITYVGKHGDSKNSNNKTEKTKNGYDPNRKKWFQLNHTVINHPKNGYEEEYEESKAWCNEQVMQDCYIQSGDGLLLHASWFPAEHAKRIVLLSHGYRGTRFGSVAHMAKFLHEQGTSLLFIDQRCCGESEGNYITFGAKEQDDVRRWVWFLHRRNKEALPIYLYGQSMGATSVLLAAGHPLPKDVKGLIADCSFHSMKQQLRDIASGWFHLHWIESLLFRTDLFCRIFGQFHMKQTDTTNALKTNTRPVLFFHGESDTYVWPENTVRNFELCRAPKELVLVPNARHLCCSFVDPELYQQKLVGFFDRFDHS